MASSQQAGRRCDDGPTQVTARQAKLHLSAAGSMLDCAVTAIMRACGLAGERAGVVDELAEDIVAVPGSARMPVDVLSE
jgi:hypothetical protein